MTYTDRDKIKKSLKGIKAFTDPKPTLPIFDYVLLQSQDCKLSITAMSGNRFGTDSSFTTFEIESGSYRDYSVLIKLKDLSKVMSKIRSDVKFCATGTTLHIKTDKLSFDLVGKDPSHFPIVPEWVGREIKVSSTNTFND